MKIIMMMIIMIVFDHSDISMLVMGRAIVENAGNTYSKDTFRVSWWRHQKLIFKLVFPIFFNLFLLIIRGSISSVAVGRFVPEMALVRTSLAQMITSARKR